MIQQRSIYELHIYKVFVLTIVQWDIISLEMFAKSVQITIQYKQHQALHAQHTTQALLYSIATFWFLQNTYLLTDQI